MQCYSQETYRRKQGMSQRAYMKWISGKLQENHVIDWVLCAPAIQLLTRKNTVTSIIIITVTEVPSHKSESLYKLKASGPNPAFQFDHF